MKTFSLKSIKVIKADALSQQDLKEIKGGTTENHDLIAGPGEVYDDEPPPDR